MDDRQDKFLGYIHDNLGRFFSAETIYHFDDGKTYDAICDVSKLYSKLFLKYHIDYGNPSIDILGKLNDVEKNWLNTLLIHACIKVSDKSDPHIFIDVSKWNKL